MTKKQEIEGYKDALNSMVNDWDYLIYGCFRAGMCFFMWGDIRDYPTVMKRKPKGRNTNEYWWNDVFTVEGSDRRIIVMLDCILELLLDENQ